MLRGAGSGGSCRHLLALLVLTLGGAEGQLASGRDQTPERTQLPR